MEPLKVIREGFDITQVADCDLNGLVTGSRFAIIGYCRVVRNYSLYHWTVFGKPHMGRLRRARKIILKEQRRRDGKR